MKNPVTAWAATAHFDIAEGQELSTAFLGSYHLSLVSAPTALWVIAKWPDGKRIGFRVVYAFGTVFESVNLTDESEEGFELELQCRLGKYRASVKKISDEPMMFRYTTLFTPQEDIFIPFCPRDVVPLHQSGNISEAEGTVHVTQEGTRSGHLYFSLDKSGSVFYFQNLTAISEYCDATETSLGGTVGGKWPETGFSLPAAMEKPVPADKEFCVSDAFVLLSEEVPAKETDVAINYLDYLAAVYLHLPKPATKYNDWVHIATQGLIDIKNNKGCWTQAEGNSYLNAYVCDYDTPPEIMVQLAVLVPLTEYFEWQGSPDPVLEEIRKGLPAFYDEKLKVIRRWLPSLKHRLDQSEEQKKEGVMDAWYLHHPLMNLTRLAIRRDKVAEKLLLDSIEFPIKVAKKFKYEWPVFYNMETLDIIKAETAEGEGGEKDVPGAYAHLMLEVRDLTGDERYFKEAVEAVKRLEGVGFDIFYQANNTAFTAATLLRMYKETQDQKYLDLSYTCIACLFRNMQIWEGSYGHAKHYSRFMSIFPLSEAPYTAAYEELEVYAALDYYLKESRDIELRPSIQLLVAEFIRYFVFRMPFYYPTVLPEEVISEDVKTGEIDRKLWIPLEDLRDGWEKSGQVGQEVYGAAGAGFGIIPRQYFKLTDTSLLLFCDYPVHDLRIFKAGAATFKVKGDAALECKIRVMGDAKLVPEVSLSQNGTEVKAFETGDGYVEFAVHGDTQYKVEWKA